jgi:hypothetical protein
MHHLVIKFVCGMLAWPCCLKRYAPVMYIAVLTKCVFARVPWARVSTLLRWVETLQQLAVKTLKGEGAVRGT